METKEQSNMMDFKMGDKVQNTINPDISGHIIGIEPQENKVPDVLYVKRDDGGVTESPEHCWKY
jgi:hypothetical protein